MYPEKKRLQRREAYFANNISRRKEQRRETAGRLASALPLSSNFLSKFFLSAGMTVNA
jgi:hypothetical protein